MDKIYIRVPITTAENADLEALVKRTGQNKGMALHDLAFDDNNRSLIQNTLELKALVSIANEITKTKSVIRDLVNHQIKFKICYRSDINAMLDSLHRMELLIAQAIGGEKNDGNLLRESHS